MSSLFSRIFSSQAPVNDGFDQSQREAIIDLLNFCSYADDKLMLAEDAVVESELAQCHWHPAEPVELFVNRSITRVRAALDSAENRLGFLHDVSARLHSSEARARALKLSKTLLGADGDYSADEQSVFAEIEKVFASTKR